VRDGLSRINDGQISSGDDQGCLAASAEQLRGRPKEGMCEPGVFERF
jgi:hypothetical protein